MEEQTNERILTRAEIPQADKWDLNSLYYSDEAWEEDFKHYTRALSEIENFKGTLARSPEQLCKSYDFFTELEKKEERLGYYAHLRVTEDLGNSDNQSRQARFTSVAVQASALASYWIPEIQSIPDETMVRFLKSDVLLPYLISLKKILR